MPQREATRRVMVVDDDEVFRTRLSRAFAQRNWESRAAGDGEEALSVAGELKPDLALIDLRMPGMDGLDLVEKLRAADPAVTIIVLTGYGSIPTTVAAMKRGADHYLSKPADADEILSAYEKLQPSDDGEADVPTTTPTLARVEWEHMQRVIADCGGNISQAARALGIHRRSLQRKLSKYPPHR
jgi:two-component system response regulator RegA